MRVENVSGIAVRLDDRFPPVARVRRNGEELQLTKEWVRHEQQSNALRHDFGMTMAPGAVRTQYFNVGKRYDLSVPGEYRVQILHPVLPGRKLEPVQHLSNETTFRVVAQSAPTTRLRG